MMEGHLPIDLDGVRGERVDGRRRRMGEILNYLYLDIVGFV